MLELKTPGLNEEEGMTILQQAISNLNRDKIKFEACPKCGERFMETRWYRGKRTCRMCGYRIINPKMVEMVTLIDKGQRISIQNIMDSIGIDLETCMEYLKANGYRF